jgi:hypothetical protein
MNGVGDLKAMSKVTPSVGPIKCPIEIRFFGLRRSGNHGVINWLIPMLGNQVCHINDGKPLCRFYNGNDGLNYTKIEIQKTDATIVSYENVDFNEGWPEFDIESPKVKYVLLLRDPFNTLASLLRNQTTIQNRSWNVPDYELEKLWVQYAKEFLKITSWLPEDTVMISYNRWFVNETYRRGIADQLELEYSEVGLNKMSGYGGGSSFDQLIYNRSAQNMDVLNRWKRFKSNNSYWHRLQYPELKELSREIFGRIAPGH